MNKLNVVILLILAISFTSSCSPEAETTVVTTVVEVMVTQDVPVTREVIIKETIEVEVTREVRPNQEFVDGYKNYDATAVISNFNENLASFRLEYPVAWNTDWIFAEGNRLFVISTDIPLVAAWSGQTDGAWVIITSNYMEDEDSITDTLILPNFPDEILEEPAEVTINGQTAMRSVVEEDDDLVITVLFSQGQNFVWVMGHTPIALAAEFQPILEDIMASIEFIPGTTD